MIFQIDNNTKGFKTLKKIQHKTTNDIEYKRCGTCKQWLPLNSFNKDNSTWDKLCLRCKSCRKKHFKQHYIKRPKKIQHKIINNTIYKNCCICKKWKPLCYFGKRKSATDGLYSQCKSCLKEYRKQHYIKHPKKIEHKIINNIEYKWCNHCKQWKPLNCFCKNKLTWDNLNNKCRKCGKKYYLDNIEQKKQQRKKYYQKNKELRKQQSRQHRINKPQQYKEYCKNNSEKISKQRKKNRNQAALYLTYAPQLKIYEELRQCPNNSELLEVKCAYCGKWFSPINQHVVSRLGAINGSVSGELRFYCSESCKRACPTYNQSKYPKGFKQATSREVVPLLRQLVLERDNYECQKCGATTKNAQLHVHHILSYMLNKIVANDPDNCITLCKSCHKEIHKQDGCKYSDLKCKN